jgi:16S rRNA (adenine1518-N6/adenine1519-N6)-dimethyltransferase
LVQKEVAQRLAAEPGDMSILGLSAQLFAEVTLGDIVPAAFFTPPPKVDSQVVILKTRPMPYFTDVNETDFFRVVKAGFSEKRKKLRSSLSGGLKIPKIEAEKLLSAAGIDFEARAEALGLDDWVALTRIVAQ